MNDYLAVLNKVRLAPELDYETIGKMLIAGMIRKYENQISAQSPDNEGHIRLEAEMRHSLKLHIESAQLVPCCVCINDGSETICSGLCCGD